jgi:hypothetical protein
LTVSFLDIVADKINPFKPTGQKWKQQFPRGQENHDKGFAVSHYPDPILEGSLVNAVEAGYLIGSHSAGALATKSFSIL